MLTTDILRGYGYKIDAGISDSVLTRCIEEAEQWFGARYFGRDNWNKIHQMPNDDPYMAGGMVTDPNGEQVYIAGYLKAISHIAYACLLRDNINATTFGSVRKRDDYSDNVDPWENCKYHDTIGRGWLREFADAKGWRSEADNGMFTETLKLG